jgi:S-DNA-T family DNA segregation ATPase FtsK/SpoIIIE
MDELQRKAGMEMLPEIDEPPARTPRSRIRQPEEEGEPEESEETAPEPPAPAPKIAKIVRPPAPVAAPTPPPVSVTPAAPSFHENYVLPSLQLLNAPAGKAREAGLSEEQLRQNLDLIVETLRLFGVQAAPGDITPGATITRYEVYPAAGVRVDKISSLGRDLSRVLCAERINILAPIPGKDSVGIEIANSNKVAVFLRELLESRDWQNTTAKIPIALGKDVYGKTLVADLAAMPHMLIGGTTGSGKSVCINCILMSFLFRFSPDDLRLVLIDPKQVEMQVYNSIPHLVVPVVTDPKKVMLALRWIINEMEKRYRILAKVGVRNIATFNARSRDHAAAPANAASPQMELNVNASDDEEDDGEDGMDEPKSPPIRVPREDDLIIPDKLPYIVVIVDELADLMQTAPADVESAVARLTAKARAAGIHLIVATQTPRREVVTGVIKTNIPARIAFQVPSGLDSRVILDENGAENLLGRGDLLYRPPGVGRLTRGQGAFVSDEEVQAVVKFAADQAEAEFVPEIHAKLSGKASPGMEVSEEDKELIIQCLEVIRQEKRASTSNLQRRLRLGYNRAAYVVDYLERIGVLGPGEGAKPREVLVDLESYELSF